jgi:hypothetical protein
LPRIRAQNGPRTTSPIHDARPLTPPTTPHGRPNPSPSCTVAERSGMLSARAPEPWSASSPNRTAQRSLLPPSPTMSTGSQVLSPLRHTTQEQTRIISRSAIGQRPISQSFASHRNACALRMEA